MTAARTPIDEARLRALWNRKGGSVRDMAKELGCGERTLFKIARDLGLKGRIMSPDRSKDTQKPKPDPKPAPVALQDRPDYPRIVAAVQRGVKPMCLAAWFGLPYRDAREVRV